MWKTFNNIIFGIKGCMSVNTLWTLITYYPMGGHSKTGYDNCTGRIQIKVLTTLPITSHPFFLLHFRFSMASFKNLRHTIRKETVLLTKPQYKFVMGVNVYLD